MATQNPFLLRLLLATAAALLLLGIAAANPGTVAVETATTQGPDAQAEQQQPVSTQALPGWGPENDSYQRHNSYDSSNGRSHASSSSKGYGPSLHDPPQHESSYHDRQQRYPSSTGQGYGDQQQQQHAYGGGASYDPYGGDQGIDDVMEDVHYNYPQGARTPAAAALADFCALSCPTSCPAFKCPTSTTYCASSSECLDLGRNELNCGFCGRSCPLDATCTEGNCVCASSTTACFPGTNRFYCSDLLTESDCGGCGVTCSADQQCVVKSMPNGLKTASCKCAPGQLVCDGVCVDLDFLNCYACGNACKAAEVCDTDAKKCCIPNAGACTQAGDCCSGSCVADVCSGTVPRIPLALSKPQHSNAKA